MEIAFKAAGLAAALAFGAGIAAANPTINVVYDPSVGFTAADETQIQNAINFYTSNITNNFTMTIAFGSQAGGGATSIKFAGDVSYTDYYTALTNDSSGDLTDTEALASLGPSSSNNPVTGSQSVNITTTLGAVLGLEANVSTSWSQCGNQTANACIDLGTDDLNIGGSPSAGLFGIVQHEFDEVLGTSSNLPNGGTGGVPADPSAADLFRYGSPGARSFDLNTSTSFPCSGTPTAYFSVNSGVTNLQDYNNCNNGGDYGDWYCDDGSLVQCFAGPGNVPASLSLSSPEVALLDAVGYNFVSATPEPSSLVMLLTGLAAIPVLRRRLTGKLRP